MTNHPIQLHQRKPLVWTDWVSQMQHRIETLDQLRAWINVTEDEALAIERSQGKYRWSITPYYASLMDRDDPNCPVRLRAPAGGAEPARVHGVS
jgi:lysine 2,3-aminomutase